MSELPLERDDGSSAPFLTTVVGPSTPTEGDDRCDLMDDDQQCCTTSDEFEHQPLLSLNSDQSSISHRHKSAAATATNINSAGASKSNDKSNASNVMDSLSENYNLSVWWITFIGFLMNADISINLPSLEIYVAKMGGSAVVYGLCISIFSFTQVILSTPFGWWFDRRGAHEVLFFTCIVCALGNLLYAIAEPLGSLQLVVWGRAIAGMGAAVTSVNFAYISRVTCLKNRTQMMARYSTISLTALIIAPGLNFLLSYLDFSLYGLPVDVYTAPSYLMALLCLLAGVGVFWLVKEPPPPHHHMMPTLPPQHQQSQQPSTTTTNPFMAPLQCVVGLPSHAYLCLALIFLNSFTLSSFQTLAPILSQTFYDFGPRDNDMLFIAIGLAAAVSSLAILFLSKHCIDGNILNVGQAALLLGTILSIRYAEDLALPVFVTSALVISSGLSLTLPLVPSMYSKAITASPAKSRVGALMGWLQTGANAARIVGPLWTAFSVRVFGHDSNVCQMGLVALCLLAMATGMPFWTGRCKDRLANEKVPLDPEDEIAIVHIDF